MNRVAIQGPGCFLRPSVILSTLTFTITMTARSESCTCIVLFEQWLCGIKIIMAADYPREAYLFTLTRMLSFLEAFTKISWEFKDKYNCWIYGKCYCSVRGILNLFAKFKCFQRGKLTVEVV